ncbi:transposable element Tcb2 transposase [Trichonephila clavipes]|nr:transposable element Tcb2 transposase [Trichonephila clavipes]
MDDNARPHRTLAVEELLESEDVTRMDWPAYSPDLNPMEHVWDALGRRIAARLHHPEYTQHLKQMLIEEWAILPQEMLHQLVLSMQRRQLGANQLSRLSAHEPIPDTARRGFPVKGILYKGTLACNPRCSKRRRIDEADISMPVALDQRATNFLEEAVRSFTAMRSRCRLSHADVILHRPLPVFRFRESCSVLICSLHTRITLELFHCTRALLRHKKILHLEGRKSSIVHTP